MLRKATALTALLVALGASPAAAAEVRKHDFDGSCELAGPITPGEPINVVPRPGATAKLHARGTCTGTINAQRPLVRAAWIHVPHAEILFDTCELGPDLGIKGTLAIRTRGKRRIRFPVTIEMIRVAVAGPFLIRGAYGGTGFGVSQLMPPDTQQALADCGDLDGGITEATLAASFRTFAPLVGSYRRQRIR